MKSFALICAKYYGFLWPVIFISFGIVALSGTHIHFKLAGLNITGHVLMWFLMGLAHADIFWRGWRINQERQLLKKEETLPEEANQTR